MRTATDDCGARSLLCRQLSVSLSLSLSLCGIRPGLCSAFLSIQRRADLRCDQRCSTYPATSARQARATSLYPILDRSNTAEGQVLKLTSQVALLGVMPMR